MRRSGPRIVIRTRRGKAPSQQPSDNETEPTVDQQTPSADEAGAGDEEGEGTGPAGSDADEPEESTKDEDDAEGNENADSDPGSGAEEPAPVVRGRGRGRPRGSGRAAYSGTGRPRGRPRGSGRGRGRPRGRAGVTLRIAKRGADSDGEEGGGEDSRAATDDGDFAESSRFRRAGGAPIPDGMVVEGDAYVTENDPKGDEKIDANGNLLDGKHVFFLMEENTETECS